MTKQAFLQHIANPFLLTEATLAEYRQLVEKYPFCSTLWMLYLKNLQLTNDIRFDEVLKRGAVSCPDRTQLFALIHQQPSNNKQDVETTVPETEPMPETSNPVTETAEPEKTSEQITETSAEEQAGNIPELEKQYLANAVNATILQEVSQLQNETETPAKKADNPPASTDENEKEEMSEDIPLGNRLNPDEQHSFDEWISLLNRKTSSPEKNTDKAKENKSKKHSVDEFDALIEQFLQKEPKIIPKKKQFYSPVNMARLSVTEDPEIVTETLALIYMQQGDFTRALRAYEKLSLKYPEKSSYFANQIKIIKQKLNKK